MREARTHPRTLVVGIDADAGAMRERSAAAGRSQGHLGLPNALFLVAGAERLPHDLDGLADELRVTLPWGSLLHGAIGPETWFVELIHRLLRPGGRAQLVLSTDPREVAAGLPRLDSVSARALADTYARGGLQPLCVRRVTTADVNELGSSWAKRLGIPARREAWFFSLRAPVGRGHVQR